MKVAVIYNREDSPVLSEFGMRTRERYNPKLIEQVASALESGGHNVKIVEGNIFVVDELQSFMPRVINSKSPALVFNMAYGIQGQSRYTHIPAMLEMLGIPYLGSGPSGHAVALDKVLSKIMFKNHNLPTPDYWVFGSPDEVPDDFPYPVVAKPKMEAVSYGLTVAENRQQLQEGIRFILDEFKQPVLVEDFIMGREFAVGILGNEDPEIFPVVEFDFGGDPYAVQSLEDKKQGKRKKICPAPMDPSKENELRYLAIEAFKALGLYDFARVDFRMDYQGKLYILEVNSMASLGLGGSYYHAAKVAGYTYKTLVNRMLDVAAARYFGNDFISDIQAEGKARPGRKGFISKIRSYLRNNAPVMEEDLKAMIEMDSHARNIEGVNRLGSWISDWTVNPG